LSTATFSKVHIKFRRKVLSQLQTKEKCHSKTASSHLTIKNWLRLTQHGTQRAGIADGGEFYIRPPGTAAWLFAKVK